MMFELPSCSSARVTVVWYFVNFLLSTPLSITARCFRFIWLPGGMYFSLALDEADCLLIFLNGLLLFAVHFSCQFKSVINHLQAEHSTSELVFSGSEALAGTFQTKTCSSLSPLDKMGPLNARHSSHQI